MFESGTGTPEPTTEGPSSPTKPQTFAELSELAPEEIEKVIPTSPKQDPGEKTPPPSDEDEDFGDDDEEGDDENVEDFGEDEDEEDGDEDEEQEEEEEEEEGESETSEDEVFLEQKVDGKLRKFTEKEVRAIVASGAHTLEKAQQFETYKAETLAQFEAVAEQIQKQELRFAPILEHLNKKDVEGAYLALAESVGLDKLEVKRALINQIAPYIFRRLQIPPDWVAKRAQECAAHMRQIDLEEENNWKTEKMKRLEEATRPKPQDPDQVALSSFQEMRIKEGIGQAEFNQVLAFIEKHEGGTKKITPSYFAQVCQMMRAVDKSVQAIRAVRPGLIDDKKFIDRVRVKAQQNPEWGVDKLARWVDKKAREKAETQRKQEVSSLQKDISRKALKGQQKSSFENPNAKQKPMRFEDIDPDNFELP